MENSNEILNELRIEVAKQKENIDSLAFMGKNKLRSVRLLKINKR